MAALEVKKDLYWIGAQDHDLRVFDVIMETQYGTSYNSFLLKTENHNILFETVKPKFFNTFMTNLQELCDPSEIDYIVINHTEPDHVGSLEKLMDYAPKAKIIGSQIALNFLADICNREIPGIPVGDNQEITIDNYTLQFLSVPFLHWPDSIYTYIKESKSLITCDSFGCHYADDKVFNDLIEGKFVDAYKYYFDMIMGPFKSHVRYALDKINELDVETICPGHGPVLRENLEYYIDLYNKWSYEQPVIKGDKPKVVTAFVSAYGYSEKLAQEITKGVKDVIDADIQLYDLVYADAEKVLSEMKAADGILVGSPTINGDALPPIMDLIMKMNGVVDGGKVAGAFGSYGWSGEGPDMLMSRLNVLRMNTVQPPLKIVFNPDDAKLQLAREYGQRFGKKLKEEWVKLGESSDGKTYWKCTVCGEIFEGALPPMTCPVCGVGIEAFIEYIPEIIDFRDDKEMNVVILGSGIGALSSAEAIRARNEKAKVSLYTIEDVLPYHRPVLTKALSEKDTDLTIHHEQYYKDKKIDFYFSKEATNINKNSKEVTFKDGETVAYDKLVIATGAHCFIPPISGATLPEVVALRSMCDLKKTHELLANGPKRVVIIGGGLLGLETADNLAKVGHDVTVIEACPTILPRQLDEEGSKLFSKSISNSSVNLVQGVFVDEITGDEHVSAVRTKDGKSYPCDFVVISAGIRSNILVAKTANLDVDRAIIVDKKMQTSEPGIYAVGDCAELQGQFDGIWETALDQGKVAGANIAGDNKEYQSKVFGATLHAFDTSIFSIGDIGTDKDTEYKTVSVKDEINGIYKKIFFKDDKLVGGILIGDVKLTNPLIFGIEKGFTTNDAKESGLI